MISLEKIKILTPLQKLSKNVENFIKLIDATGFEKLPKSNKLSNLVTLLGIHRYQADNYRISKNNQSYCSKRESLLSTTDLHVEHEDQEERDGKSEDKAVEGEGRLAVEDVRPLSLHGARVRVVLLLLVVVVEGPEDVAALASLRLGDRGGVHEDRNLTTSKQIFFCEI